MSWQKGNKYWKIRKKSGRDRKFTPEDIEKQANRYFKYCMENPLREEIIVNKSWIEYTNEVLIVKGEEQIVEKKITHPFSRTYISKMRPFTIQGFCNFIGLQSSTLNDYSKLEDYSSIVAHVYQIIYNQKFEGAAVGMLNSNIIARDLSLVDKQEVKKNIIKFKNVSKQFPDEE